MSRWTPAITSVGLFLHGSGVVISAAEGLRTCRRVGEGKKKHIRKEKGKKNTSKQQRHTWNNARRAPLTRERKKERKKEISSVVIKMKNGSRATLNKS